ncbi:MAG: lysine--tRNA ligase [Candidatus Levybacteria bacterium]|nr:lysine--tRNA ligase [Candidatus Levybacteria bacterium]
MFWADKLLENRTGKEWINDAWTPSGIIHMGGLKGPVIHDVLFKVLQGQGKDVKYTYGFDDMDAIDGLPSHLQEKLGQYMGIPICNAPAPEGEGTFGEYYASFMRELFAKLGIGAEIYLASDYYKKGLYDEAIRFVLDNAQKVRNVYGEMYAREIASDWFPLQVVCPTCGKVGTTTVTGWDGNEVAFECSPTKVKWAQGCGMQGKISPFGGNATMPFKVEWAAKWWVFGVTIEGAGKDHASAGGTYDVARKIIKDVFGVEPPLKLPYEFFLYDGKKMSSSKGLGLTGQELLEVMPPEMVRFLMIKNEPNTAVEFNPFGTQIIPKLYEDYQKAAFEFENSTGSDLARAFELSQIGEVVIPPQFRFLTLAQWVQMPNMEDEIRKEGLSGWAKYAKVWVEKYAPENDKFLIQKELPDVSGLSFEQKEYLRSLAQLFENEISAEDLQTAIYEKSKEQNLKSIDAFKAIYTSFLGKDHGPKAAWLLQSLDKNFVKQRLQEASK